VENIDPSPCLPQKVEPGIDFLAHVLLQRLGGEAGGRLITGIRSGAVAMVQPTRPIALFLTTDGCGSDKDVVKNNLATVACAVGVPVVYTLSRRHMGEACGVSFGISAVAIARVDDEQSSQLLASIMDRAAKAYDNGMEAAVAAALTACGPAAALAGAVY
jgi:ribosomal protein L30E